jgi:hypothetical protein
MPMALKGAAFVDEEPCRYPALGSASALSDG